MMIPALVLSLLSPILQDKPDYTVPVGASSEFHHLVIDIEKALEAKDYPTAQKLGKLLPRSSVSFRIDSSKLSDIQKTDYGDAIRSAAIQWQQQLTSSVVKFNFVTTPKADIMFTFEPELAKIDGTNEVAGATWFLATEPGQPFLEAVIGMKRGPKLAPVMGREVYNESLFSFGRYLGLAPSPLLGTAMGRIEGQMGNSSGILPQEAISASKILKLSDYLRTAIEKKLTIEINQPSAVLEKKSLQFDTVFQGDQGRAQMLVTNQGTSPLELQVRGDCGCIGGTVAASLEPGKSTLLTGIFDTTELVGDVHHNLVLRTNDPEQPVVLIPVSIKVTPRAEAIFPKSNTIYMDGSQKSFEFYIHSAEEKIFQVTESAMSDPTLKYKLVPFSGEVENFSNPGVMQKVRGYKVTIDTTKYPAQGLFGRIMSMLFLKTDNAKIPVVKISVFLQKGIVCSPESIYLGTPKGPVDGGFTVSRPGRPFVIKKVSSTSKYLTFQVKKNELLQGSEYYVKVIYDGKALGHKFKSEIIIETDDPGSQATIRLPIQTSGL